MKLNVYIDVPAPVYNSLIKKEPLADCELIRVGRAVQNGYIEPITTEEAIKNLKECADDILEYGYLEMDGSASLYETFNMAIKALGVQTDEVLRRMRSNDGRSRGMKVVVELSKEEMESYKNAMRLGFGNSAMRKIVNGTPLPKRHGRIGDFDLLESHIQAEWMNNEISNGEWIQFREWLRDEPTIIEADKEGTEE